MYKFGFIGFGSMANMLINGFIKYANIRISEIAVTRKDKSKLNEITETFAGIKTYEEIRQSVYENRLNCSGVLHPVKMGR